MNEFVIITDSASDLPASLAKEMEVEVIQLEVNMEGDLRLNDEVDVKEFYDYLRAKHSAKTSAVNMDRFMEHFGSVAAGGKDILYVSFSSGLSATYMAAKNAAEEIMEKYPDVRIVVVDSLCASLGQGLFVKLAYDKKKEGATIDEIAAYLEEKKPNLAHWFTVDDLFFLKRGGRVSAATAVVGTMLQIKPVLHVDDAGKLISMDKARGRQGSLKALLERMRATAIDPASQTVYISHGDCYDDAKRLADMISEELGVTDVLISEIGPVIGAHAGPGTVALFFLASER